MQRQLATWLGQLHSDTRRVFNQARIRERLDHRRRCAWHHTKRLSHLTHCHICYISRSPLLGYKINVLNIIFDRGAWHRDINI